MKTKRILQAGQPGTKKLVERYGDNLICVRHRYDDQNKRMCKTIEIIIEDKPWQENNKKIPKYESVDIRIGYNEIELRRRIKEYGGRWEPQRKVWQLPYEKVKELELLNRIVDDAS